MPPMTKYNLELKSVNIYNCDTNICHMHYIVGENGVTHIIVNKDDLITVQFDDRTEYYRSVNWYGTKK